MKLQISSRLAIFALLEVAARPDRRIAVAEIGRKYHASNHHLAKVMHVLTRAGLVRSLRGARGGYRFSGNARRTTLLEVIELFEDLGAAELLERGDDELDERPARDERQDDDRRAEQRVGSESAAAAAARAGGLRVQRQEALALEGARCGVESAVDRGHGGAPGFPQGRALGRSDLGAAVPLLRQTRSRGAAGSRGRLTPWTC